MSVVLEVPNVFFLDEEMLTEGFTQELLPLHALIFSILAIPFDSFKSIKSSIELEVTFFAARK